MFEQYSTSETIAELKTDVGKGLTMAEAGRRRKLYGTNEMKAARKKTVLE